jgi:hypothetical protein
MGQKAEVGQEYYVLNTWNNKYGTLKLKLIDYLGDEFYTTDTAVEILEFVNQDAYNLAVQKYIRGLNAWRERNFIPVLVMIMKGYNGQTAFSATKASILIGRLGQNKTGFWLAQRHCHPDDWEAVKNTVAGNAVSVRIPKWYAKKNKLIG